MCNSGNLAGAARSFNYLLGEDWISNISNNLYFTDDNGNCWSEAALEHRRIALLLAADILEDEPNN